MNEFKLVSSDSDILHRRIPDFIGQPEDYRDFAFELYKFMVRSGGVGIAANQVGHELRMFINRGPEGWGFRDALICFNPEVFSVADGIVTGPEGCLTFPGETLEIDRPEGIVVRYIDLKNRLVERFLYGAAARVFLHELDHLNGIVMHERVSINTDETKELEQ